MATAKRSKKYADSLEAKGLCRINAVVPIELKDQALENIRKMRETWKEQNK